VRPYLEKTPSQKRAGRVAQDVGPEFKPQYCHKKKKIWIMGRLFFGTILTEPSKKHPES
jgi:hypothetical protein